MKKKISKQEKDILLKDMMKLPLANIVLYDGGVFSTIVTARAEDLKSFKERYNELIKKYDKHFWLMVIEQWGFFHIIPFTNKTNYKNFKLHYKKVGGQSLADLVTDVKQTLEEMEAVNG
jgi:hypothetical protein